MTKLNIIGEFNAPGRGPAGLTWDGTYVWVADYTAGHIFQLDHETGSVIDKLWCPGVLSGLTWNGEYLWQALLEEGWVRVINSQTQDFDRTMVVENPGRVGDLTWDGQYLWVVSQELGLARAIDPETDRVKRELRIPVASGGIAYKNGALWLAYPDRMTFANGQFDWTIAEPSFAVAQLDLQTGREMARYAVDFLPLGLTWVGDELWLSGGSRGRVYRSRPG